VFIQAKNYRLTKPKEITEKTFTKILALASGVVPEIDEDKVEEEFPEGKVFERMHKVKERNAKVVSLAKKRFYDKHQRFFCQVCEFDFEKVYGEIGKEFIEAHHTIPVSELLPASKTRVKDIALVCSNCHSMLHRRRPWLTMSELSDLID